MAFDWQKLLELAPLALMKPGSPEAGAMMRGYLQSQQRLRQEQRQKMLDTGTQQVQQAQIQNLTQDNQRSDAQLALQRLMASRNEGEGVLKSLATAPETYLPAGTDPLQAQNDLVVENFKAQQAYGVPPGTPQGSLPNMTSLVSEGKKRRAKARYDALVKNLFNGDEAMAEQAHIKDSEGEFAGQSPTEIRALFMMPAVTAAGQAATPSVKPPAVTTTETERAQELLGKIDAAKATGDTGAAAKFQHQYDNLVRAKRDLGQADNVPREPSARTVDAAREQAYQAVLEGGSVTAAARALRRAGIDDPDVELGRIRRQVDADVRAMEARLPVDTDAGENRADPAVYQQRLDRARAALRASVTGGSDVTPPPAVPPNVPALRQEAKRQLQGARQAAGDTRQVTDAEIDTLLVRPGNADVLRRQMGR